MRTIAISVAVAAVLFLVTGGRLILIPLLFIPLALFTQRRARWFLPATMTRTFDLKRKPG
jgi:hypothetical protein